MAQLAVKPFICIENEETYISIPARDVRELGLFHNIGGGSRMTGEVVLVCEKEWLSAVLPNLDSRGIDIRFERSMLTRKDSLLETTVPYKAHDIKYPVVIGSKVAGGEVVDVVTKADVELGDLAVESPAVAVQTDKGTVFISLRHLPVADAAYKRRLEADLMTKPVPPAPSAGPRP